VVNKLSDKQNKKNIASTQLSIYFIKYVFFSSVKWRIAFFYAILWL